MACWRCGDDHDYGECPMDAPAQQASDAGLLPQHRRCWTCKQVTLAWDNQPCGQHARPGQAPPAGEAPPVTPPRRQSRDLAALARQQAAEARAGHPDLDAWLNRRLNQERRQIRHAAEPAAAAGTPAAPAPPRPS